MIRGNVMHPDELRQWIIDHLPCEHVEVTGDGRHFEALIVSDEFIELNRLRRQQLVYGCLHDKISSGTVHALSMQTLTKNEYQKLNG
jgi:acid stress-induced BolA-like protein IbaG/YrbA